MKNIKKWILRLAIAFVALIILLLVIVYFSLDGIVRFGVERGATQATGQTTSLDSAKVSIAGGSLELSGLDINNPPGYSNNKIIAMKDCKATAQIGSLLTNDVVIPEVDIDGLEVSLEQNGLKSNLSEVLAVGQSSTPAAGGSSAPTPPGKNIHIGVIKLTNTKVHVSIAGAGTTLDLGSIEIQDPTNPDGRPMKLADVVSKILMNVAQQIANNPQIPDALKGSITQVQGVITNVGGVLKNDTKDLGNGLGNLFGNKKKDQ